MTFTAGHPITKKNLDKLEGLQRGDVKVAGNPGELNYEEGLTHLKPVSRN